MKPVKFLPLVALAAFSLLALKLAGLMLGEEYMVTGSRSSVAKAIPDSDPGAESKANNKQSGSDKKAGEKPKPNRVKKKKGPPKDVLSLGREDHRTNAEIDLLTSLSKRRKQLDQRETELLMRVNLIKAAEKRVEQRIATLKKLDSKIQHYAKMQKDEKVAQYNRLVKMYSSMKPKGAALIFNELDKKVLLGIIQNMKPQPMSAILAAMAPAKAREITISLAGVAQQEFSEQKP